MLLSHLHESDDELPLLARIIQGRLKAGEKIRLNAKLPKEREAWWGPLHDVKMGTMLQVNYNDLSEVQRLFLTWKQGGRVGERMREWVRADTFDDRFELKKDAAGMADWVLVYRSTDIAEGLVDGEEPLLVTLIDQRLQAGERVLININIPSLGNPQNNFNHIGQLHGIAELEMKSAQMERLAGGKRGVTITYEKSNPSPGYKGTTTIVLSPSTFDDLFTLEKTKSFGQPAWTLVNA